MHKLIATLLVALSLGSANAALQASRGDDYIILHTTTCSGPALEAVRAKNPPPEYVFYNAVALINNQPFRACYTVLDDTVGVIYEDGDVSMIPVKAFKETSV